MAAAAVAACACQLLHLSACLRGGGSNQPHHSLPSLDTVQQLLIQLYQAQVAAQATLCILQVPWLGRAQLQRHPCCCYCCGEGKEGPLLMHTATTEKFELRSHLLFLIIAVSRFAMVCSVLALMH
jgi:hypothetical protein